MYFPPTPSAFSFFSLHCDSRLPQWRSRAILRALGGERGTQASERARSSRLTTHSEAPHAPLYTLWQPATCEFVPTRWCTVRGACRSCLIEGRSSARRVVYLTERKHATGNVGGGKSASGKKSH